MMEAFGISPEENTVRIERLYPGPIERLWAYITESELRKTWFASGEFDLRPGGETNLLFRHCEITSSEPPEKYREMHTKGHLSTGTVTRCEPPHVFSFLWATSDGDNSEVTFELSQEREQVRLVLTHRRLCNRDAMANVASGWHLHLHVLRNCIDGKRNDDFWDMLAEIEPEYQRLFGVV